MTEKLPDDLVMHPVTSSNISRVGYVEAGPTDDQLVDVYVEFGKSMIPTTYVYHGVPMNTYEGLLKADSVGKFLNQHIKGTYAFDKCQ